MKFYEKLVLLLIAHLIFVFNTYSQVGINTEKPLGILHIDPLKNTTGTVASPSNDEDDIIVNSSGNMGVGTVNPVSKLHIKTQGTESDPIPGLKLIDGNQKEDYALTSDANGVATWSSVNPLEAIFFQKGSNPNVTIENTSSYKNTNSYIELPPGRYVVMVAMLPNLAETKGWDLTGYYSLSTTFADEKTVLNAGSTLDKIISPDIEGLQVLSVGTSMGTDTSVMLVGSLVINNKTSANKKYYYMVGDISVSSSKTGFYLRTFGGSWGEDAIVAFKISDKI